MPHAPGHQPVPAQGGALLPLGAPPTPLSSAGAAAEKGVAVPSLAPEGGGGGGAGQPGGFSRFLEQNSAGLAGILAGLGAKALGRRSGPAVRVAMALQQAQQQRAQQQRQFQQRQQQIQHQQRQAKIQSLYQSIRLGSEVGLSRKDQTKQVTELFALQGIKINPVTVEAALKHPVFFNTGSLSNEDVAEGKRILLENPGLRGLPEVAAWEKRADFRIGFDDRLEALVKEEEALSGPKARTAAERATALQTVHEAGAGARTAEKVDLATQLHALDKKAEGGNETVRIDAAVKATVDNYKLITGEDMDPEQVKGITSLESSLDSTHRSQLRGPVYESIFGADGEREFLQQWKDGNFRANFSVRARNSIADRVVETMDKEEKLGPGDAGFESKLFDMVADLGVSPGSDKRATSIGGPGTFAGLSDGEQQRQFSELVDWILKNKYGQSEAATQSLMERMGLGASAPAESSFQTAPADTTNPFLLPGEE